MADEIKQTRQVGGVLPPSRARDHEKRKPAGKGPVRSNNGRREKNGTADGSRKVDEYV